MANRQRGEIALIVAGQDYTLRLTTDGIAQLEDACSTPEKAMFFPDILALVLRGSVKYTRLFVWACLREAHPEMTVADAGTLMDGAGGPIGFAQLVEAVVATTQPDPEDRPRPQTAQAMAPGIGGRSTSRRAKSA